ncbi:MAG: hypothetical protein SGJ09_12015 [Phycisphaerae bacterium]|nr:hypothetical protein [Phycisphaerae bacterium]
MSLFSTSLAFGAPPNDECADAIPITAVVTLFCTNCATTDGPPLDPSCDEGFGLSFVDDIWFSYLATASGEVCVSTCGVANFDTRLAVYSGACGSLVFVGCSDDSVDCSGFTSELVFTATASTIYRIRVGGFSSVGCGSLLVSRRECAECPNSTHDCFTPSRSPGCSDIDCCIALCVVDPFCCDVSWDAVCVDEADDFGACARFAADCPIVPGEPFNNCSLRYLLVEDLALLLFDSTGATTDGPTTDCAYAHDIWFGVDSIDGGRLTVEVTGASFNPVIAIYDIGTHPSFDPSDLPSDLLQCGNAQSGGDEVV